MNWSETGKKYLPHVIIIVIFFFLSLFYLAPVWQQNKVLPQNDVKQWAGSYQETFLYLEKTGERSLWTNSMFGGMPTYQIAPYSKNSLIGLKIFYGWFISGDPILPVPVNAIFLYLLSSFLMLLAFRVNVWVAMMGAIAFAFVSFNLIIIEAGHMLQAYAIGTAPLIIGALVYTIRFRSYFLGSALFGVALAFHLRTNHPQMSYYIALVIGFYLIAEIIHHVRSKNFMVLVKAGSMLAIAAILAIGTSITFLWTTNEYAKQSIRGKSELTQPDHIKSTGLDRDYAFQWSFTPGETFSILIPNFRGGPSGAIGTYHKDAVENGQFKEAVLSFDQYWGGQPFTSGPVYFGAGICFLFVLGLFMLKGTDKWWAVAVAILSLMLSWGHNFAAFNNFIFDYLPLYNKFRSPTFTLVMAGIAFPLLASILVDRFLRHVTWTKEDQKKFFWALGITGGLCLLFMLVPSLAGDFVKPDNGDLQSWTQMLQRSGYQQEEIQQLTTGQQWGAILDGVISAREKILTADAGRSLLFILLTAALLFAYFKGKIKKPILLAGLIVLVLVDLWSVDKRYLNDKVFVTKQNNTMIPSAADEMIMRDTTPNYRVINIAVNTFNDATTSYFHKSVGGYHGAKMRRFQELAERYLYTTVNVLQQNISKLPPEQLLQYMQEQGELGKLNMFNTKYIIYGQKENEVLRNPYALGNCWIVKGIQWVPNADSEIAAIAKFNPADTAIIDERFKSYMQGFTPTEGNASIKLTEYRPNNLTYQSEASAESFAVFSEVYYDKGWNAYLDGNKVEHVRVDWILRGMRIPAGKHTIVFKFEPESFIAGEKYTLIASILLIVFVLGGIAYSIFKGRREEPMPFETTF